MEGEETRRRAMRNFRSPKELPKETPWEPSTEQNGAGRGQTWHKAVHEKEKGKQWEREEHFSLSPRNRRGLCEAG